LIPRVVIAIKLAVLNFFGEVMSTYLLHNKKYVIISNHLPDPERAPSRRFLRIAIASAFVVG